MMENENPPSPAIITMVVPGYKVGAMLVDALNSILAQNFQVWEVIVIDDGDREVAAYVAPYLTDRRFRLIQTENRGIAAARNHAIRDATTPFVGLLDGDDIIETDFMSAMVDAVQASPRVGFAGCDATYFGTDRVGELFSSYVPQRGPASLANVIRREFNVYVGVVIRTEAIKSVGYFDPSLRLAEDFDCWIRLLEAGWEMAYVPRSLARYRRHKGQASRNRIGMLRCELEVTRQAERRLFGRPEATTAAEMCARLERELEIAEAFRKIEERDVRAGLADFDRLGSDVLTLRWRYVIRVLRIAPFLAPLLLRLRRFV
jgi:glycosyltransferase involved in cell wall biosynthesis